MWTGVNKHRPYVTHIDKGVRRFANLEELILTGNLITQVSTAQLPPEIKVLELCYNQLTGIPCVEGVLGQLQHLGLAFNRISHLELTPSHWPLLLSLDLSHNHLCDLYGTTATLQGMRSLRSLMLTGNPITFAQCYKKFTVDCLRQLISLDGINVTSSMKEEAFGSLDVCVNQQELISTCKLTLNVSEVSNLPQLQTKESCDQEDKIVRYLLAVRCGFLRNGQYVSLPDANNNLKKILTHLSSMDSADQRHVFFEPAIYKADISVYSKMIQTFEVTDLGSLVDLLAEGVKVSVCLTKVVYGRMEQPSKESPSVARKFPTNAKGNKSGRTSAQSRASSTSKKQVAVKVGKGKAIQDQTMLPEESWELIDMTTFKLGCSTLDVSALLEEKAYVSITSSLCLGEEDHTRLVQSGLIHSGENETDIALTMNFTVKQL
ncbi:uncharacterized protein LOC135339962 isoform X2 [Halichondria panicea]|uniref:uncharacterized protein LOC135339962 isoform X2 n=1 Tax=Halichondria panicea TaxID=6063 RepID=UPI00312B725D